MRGRSASLMASQQLRMSPSVQRARPQMTGPLTSRAMVCTAAKSPGLLAGEPGLDDVDAQARQLMGYLQLLRGVQAAAGRLLAVAERGVEEDDGHTHVAPRGAPDGAAPADGFLLDMSLPPGSSTKSWLLICRMAPASRISPPSGGAAGGGRERERAVRQSQSEGRTAATQDQDPVLLSMTSEFSRRKAETVHFGRSQTRSAAMLKEYPKFTAAAVQTAPEYRDRPVYFDSEATLHNCIARIKEAASNGATLVVFPELHLPGYCHFSIDLARGPEYAGIWAEYLRHGIEVPERGDRPALRGGPAGQDERGDRHQRARQEVQRPPVQLRALHQPRGRDPGSPPQDQHHRAGVVDPHPRRRRPATFASPTWTSAGSAASSAANTFSRC